MGNGLPYDEDELLAYVCSNHSPRSLAIAAVTGMYGAGSYGKTLADCFYDKAAARTDEQKKRGSATKGRISIGLTHAVGRQAVSMINKLGLQGIVDASGDLDQDYWDFEVDTKQGWRKYGDDLKKAFLAIATGEPKDAYFIQIGCYESLDEAWDMIEAHPSPNCKNISTVVALSRVLNSYGGYANYVKHPYLYNMLDDHDPMNSILNWYATKGDTKERRSRFIRKLVKPFDCRITGLGELAAPQEQTIEVVTLRDAQTKLESLGYYKGEIDGDFGRGSRKALNEWCDDAGHDGDDLIDNQIYLLPYTRELLSRA